MKVDFNQELKTYHNLPMRIDEKGTFATLKFVALEALMAPPQPDSAKLSAEEILRRNDLCRRIWASTGPIDIDIETVALIKKLIPVRFCNEPILAAPALELLS